MPTRVNKTEKERKNAEGREERGRGRGRERKRERENPHTHSRGVCAHEAETGWERRVGEDNFHPPTRVQGETASVAISYGPLLRVKVLLAATTATAERNKKSLYVCSAL